MNTLTHTSLNISAKEQLGRVAVLMGGESAEREISLRSGSGVLEALLRQGVDAFAFDPAKRLIEELKAEKTDRAFIALHGRFGEDGTVQGALELLRIPYTGSGVMASSIALDKVITKRLWSADGLPTPAFALLTQAPNVQELIEKIGLPMAIKPVSEGSSLGFTKVVSADQVLAAFEKAHLLDSQVIAEAFVSGREFTCAILQDESGEVRALPVIEIVAPQGNYDYQHKYFGTETRYLCPAPISAELENQMREISRRAFSSIGCSGWARVDLMWDGVGAPALLEINTSPGMTDHSLVPMAAKQAGMSYDALVVKIAMGAGLKIRRPQ